MKLQEQVLPIESFGIIHSVTWIQFHWLIHTENGLTAIDPIHPSPLKHFIRELPGKVTKEGFYFDGVFHHAIQIGSTIELFVRPVPEQYIPLRRPSDGEVFLLTHDRRIIIGYLNSNQRAELFTGDEKVDTSSFGWFDHTDKYGSPGCHVDLQTMTVHRGTPSSKNQSWFHGRRAVSTKAIRAGIVDRRLVIQSAKGDCLAIRRSRRRGLVWETIPNGRCEPAADFTPTITTPKPWRRKMRVAKFSNGSAVWMDHRGFLHLRSHDPSIPEVTLTLENPVTAWASNALLVGPQANPQSYYRAGESGDIIEAITQFVRSLSDEISDNISE